MDCRHALAALALAPVGETAPRAPTGHRQDSSFRARLSRRVTAAGVVFPGKARGGRPGE